MNAAAGSAGSGGIAPRARGLRTGTFVRVEDARGKREGEGAGAGSCGRALTVMRNLV